MDLQRDLAGLGAEHDAGGLDEVADVEHAVEEVDALLAQLIRTQEELHLAGAVLDVGEGELAHRTRGADAAGQRDLQLGARLLRGLEAAIASALVCVRSARVG